ncbi:MAG: hypothetical protein QXU23_07555 [Candidatus Korarchaeum sp.]
MRRVAEGVLARRPEISVSVQESVDRVDKIAEKQQLGGDRACSHAQQ